MINFYSYTQNLELTLNFQNQLESRIMFNDKIILFKNRDNVLSFNIKNRDRVVQTPETVILSIFDNRKVQVLKEYLELVETDRFYKLVLPKATVNAIPTGKSYIFSTHYVDEDGLEIPLYTDHNLSIFGNLWVEDTEFIPSEISYSGFGLVERVVDPKYDYNYQANFNSLLDMAKEYKDYLYRLTLGENGFIQIDKNFYDIEIETSEVDSVVYILKHNKKRFPVTTTDLRQWDIHTTIHKDNANIEIEKLPNGLYQFLVASDETNPVVNFTHRFI